jgi:hypothetical protein
MQSGKDETPEEKQARLEQEAQAAKDKELKRAVRGTHSSPIAAEDRGLLGAWPPCHAPCAPARILCSLRQSGAGMLSGNSSRRMRLSTMPSLGIHPSKHSPCIP